LNQYLRNIRNGLFRHLTPFTKQVNGCFNRLVKFFKSKNIEMEGNLTSLQIPNELHLLQTTTHLIVEITECNKEGTITRTFIKKATSGVSVSSIDFNDTESEVVLPYDIFVQVVSGEAELLIKGQQKKLKAGLSMVIPAFVKHRIICKKQFKIVSTILKKGF
jgi:mannose-6-phosphate isomerase-like protein (cupin superfamily)